MAPLSASAGPLDGVTECDYRRLSELYGEPRAKIKRRLRADARGSKLVDTPRGVMAEAVYWQVLSAGKIPAKCSFSQTAYTTADADALAAYWATDRAGAQQIVESKIASGQDDSVVWALEDMRYGKVPKAQDPEAEALDTFWASERYSYCDARLVAGAWQTDPYTAKVSIGAKLLQQDRAALQALEQTLTGARHQAISRREGCEFWETDYSPEDAMRLAAAWGTSVESAKARVADMVLRGQDDAVRDMLRRAP